MGNRVVVRSGRKVVAYDNILDQSPKILPAEAIVKFNLNEHETIAVHMTPDGKLEIRSEGSSLIVYLSAANEIFVQPRGN